MRTWRSLWGKIRNLFSMVSTKKSFNYAGFRWLEDFLFCLKTDAAQQLAGKPQNDAYCRKDGKKMESIGEKLKDGKVVSYKFKVFASQ